MACAPKEKERRKKTEREKKKRGGIIGRILTFNTPFWVRPSIGLLWLHGHYPHEVADLHAYTSGSGQNVVSKQKRIRGHNNLDHDIIMTLLLTNKLFYSIIIIYQ